MPCGKCEACVANKASQWYVRLKQQLRDSFNAVFVTLTYDEDNLPDYRIDDQDFINVDVSSEDIRLYHYRLRKALGPEKSKQLKYFLTSEYGPSPVNGWLNRPHYHAIYFNIDRCDYDKITKAWNKGHVEFGEDITEGRMRYLAGYVIEKLYTPIGRKPVFNRVSNGLGLGYVQRMRHWHQGDVKRVYVPNHGGRLPLPRYYKERIYSESQRAVFSLLCNERSEAVYAADLARFGGDGIAVARHYYDVRANFVRKQRERHKRKKN